MNDTALREVSHLTFLEYLYKKYSINQFIIKGGVNLRFFLNSPRYSEDMDLDVLSGSVETLKKNCYKILKDNAFLRNLKVYGIKAVEINNIEKAKQTNTTQRFKFRLITSSGISLPTKVEFSRRTSSVEGSAVDYISSEISNLYQKKSFKCQHYDGKAAGAQKVAALAGRAITQCRDVFDLHILDLSGFLNKKNISNIDTALRQKAAENMHDLSYEEFEGQVLEYLDQDERKKYETPVEWEEIKNKILEYLYV